MYAHFLVAVTWSHLPLLRVHMSHSLHSLCMPAPCITMHRAPPTPFSNPKAPWYTRLLCQVLLDWRGQHSKLGKWTKEGLEIWRERTRAFLMRAAAASKKPKPLTMQVAKLANWRSILALDQGLRAVGLQGVSQFMPVKRATQLAPGVQRRYVPTESLPEQYQLASFGRPLRSVLLMPDGSTQFECVWSGSRDVLHISLDCGTIGWPSRGWLIHSEGMRGERWLGPCHRRSNNIIDALVWSGLAVFRSEGLVLTNTNAGPWGEAANYQKWKSCVEEYLESTDTSDEFFMAFYPYMSHDLHQGCLPPEFGTEGHMQFVREEIRGMIEKGKGTIVRSNRWFALWQRLRPFIPYWSMHLFTNMVQCVQRGIYGNVSECRLFPASAGVGGPAGQLGAGALAKGADAPAPGQRGVRPKAGGDLEGLRGTCQNSLHLSTEVLSTRSSRSVLLGLCTLVQPVEIKHNLDVISLKTQLGRQHINIQLACSEGLQYIQDTYSLFNDVAALTDMGVLCHDTNHSEATLDAEMCQLVLGSLIAFWRSMAALEVMFVQLHSMQMPGIAFTQLHASAGPREAGMATMKALWQKLEEVEKLAPTSHHLQEFIRDLEWPQNTWCRELMVSASECRWERLPDDMLEQVRAASRVVGSSKPVEDSFNWLRGQTEGVRNGRQGPQAIWHAVAMSPVGAECDMHPIEAEPVDQAAAGTNVPPAMFESAKGEPGFSMGSAAKERFFKSKGHPTQSIPKYLQISLANRALLEAPSVRLLEKAWQSLLPIGGSIIWTNAGMAGLEEVAGLVMMGTPHGVLLWRGQAMGTGAYRHFKLEAGTGRPWQQVVIWNPGDWKCMSVEPRTASWVQQVHGIPALGTDMGAVSLQVLPTGNCNLLQFSAMHGFPHMNLAYLNKLWSELKVKVDGRKPTLMHDVLKALVTWVLGGLTEEGWQEVLARRSEHNSRNIWHSALDDNIELAKEMVCEADHEQLERDAGPEKHKKRKLDPDMPKSHPAADQPDGDEGVAGAPGSSTDVLAPKRAKKVAPFSIKHYTVETARELLPAAKGCTISPVGNRQWQVKYKERPFPPRSHTCTYDEPEGSNVEHCRALVQCLEWAWRVHHEELGRDRCPHNFDIILAGH